MIQTENGTQWQWPLGISVFLALVAVISIAVQLALPIMSTDIWWHMLFGRHILESGSLIIDHSIFTWTPATSYSVYNSWLADIILYLTHELAGISGLIALRYLVYGVFFLLAWYYAIKRGVARSPVTWAIIILGLALAWSAFPVKPELFTVGFMAVTVWLYFHIRFVGDRAWYLPYIFPLMLVAWVNMHGAFFIVSLFFAATFVGELLNIRFSPSQAMPLRLRRHYLIALALCIPAIVVNPFGYELPLHIISAVLTKDPQYSQILAYSPTFNFNDPPLYLLDYLIIAMLLFVFLVWQKLKNRQTDWVVILAFLGYAALFIKVGRAAFFLGPVFLFVSLDLLAKKEGSWAWPASTLFKYMLTVLCITIVVIIGGRVLNFKWCSIYDTQDSFKSVFGISSTIPVAETEFIKRNLQGGKIGNIYRDGGYLLYRLWPEKQVMIDPRYFPFKDWIGEYFGFANGANIEQFVNSYAADYWLINYNYQKPFIWFSQSDDWEVAFLGPTGVVFVPSGLLHQKMEISSDIDSLDEFDSIILAFTAVLQLDDLTFARRLYEAAKNNLGRSCKQHTVLIDEMKNSLAGFQAFNDGNYIESSRLLGKPGSYIHAQGKAVSGLIILAERSWNAGAFYEARKWYLNTFDIMPSKTIIDIYNLALVDWHYRHLEKTDQKIPDDNLNWQDLVAFILEHETELPESHGFIAETAKAMKEGSYDGTAGLVRRYVNASPAKSTD